MVSKFKVKKLRISKVVNHSKIVAGSCVKVDITNSCVTGISG